MRTTSILAAMLIQMMTLMSCSSTGGDETPTPATCDPAEDGQPSVLIAVRTQMGEPLPGASVTYSANGGDFRAATCVEDVALEACTDFKAGFEVAGDFVIRVEKAGYEPAESTVTVGKTANGCHVETESIAVELEQVTIPCTEEVRPSVLASLFSQDGQALAGATVTYRVNGGEVLEAQCANGAPAENCTVFVAGREVSGTFLLRAEKKDFEPVEKEVEVPMTEDGCHVVTQEVALVLPPAKCTGEPQPAVQLSVMDDVTWNAIAGATVTYSLNGDPFVSAVCAADVPPAECLAFHVGYDVSGELLMRANAPGYLEGEKTVWVAMDAEGCHSVTQIHEIRLTPLAQTASTRVKVVDTLGETVAGATVEYLAGGKDWRLADCRDETVALELCTEFVAGWNVVGQFVIRAEKGGVGAAEVSTNVGWDEEGCEPITENVKLVLNPTP